MIVKVLITFLVIIIVLISLLIYSQKQYYQQVNNEMRILQIADPNPESLFDLYQMKLPIIIQEEIQNWEGFGMVLGLDYKEIRAIIDENMENVLKVIKGNLAFQKQILGYDWNIDLKQINYTDKSPIFVIKQVNYLQLFATITGEARVVLVPPSEHDKLGTFNANVSNLDLLPELDKDNSDIECVEVVLRKGNMIYIPYQWHYFIYGNTAYDSTIMLSCINMSLIDFF